MSAVFHLKVASIAISSNVIYLFLFMIVVLDEFSFYAFAFTKLTVSLFIVVCCIVSSHVNSIVPVSIFKPFPDALHCLNEVLHNLLPQYAPLSTVSPFLLL